jgi:hypothetical protein
MALTTVDQGLLNSYAQYTGFKNRFINGNFGVDQRNAGASQSISSGAYTVDRWKATATGATVTGQQVAGSLSQQYNYRFTGAASTTGIYFEQRIEAANCQDLAGGTATISVNLANSLLTTVTWYADYANSTNNFASTTSISSGTFTINSTLTRYSATFNVPSAATTGIVITFYVGAQTSGTWTLGAAQIEKGSTATSFDYRPYGTELALCQRYYQKSYKQSVVPGTAAVYDSGNMINSYWSASNAGTLGGCSVGLPVTMRSAGTLTVYDQLGASAKVSVMNSGGSDSNGVSINASTALESAVWVRIYNSSGSVGIVFAYTVSSEL